MKKAFKIIGITLLSFIVIIMIFIVYLSKKPAVPTDYAKKVETKGEIESKYIQSGNYDVENTKIKVMENYKSYTIYYPSSISSSNQKFPVIIFSNGTGIKASSYPALLEHLASWGFIVVGTEEEYSWNGFSSEMCLRLMIKLNESEKYSDWDTNPFYGKVDLNNIGVSGHSQGGVGVINATTDTKHSNMIKAIYAASTTNKTLASALEWDFDATKINVPTLLVAGTGDMDSKTILPLEAMMEIYNDIPNNVSKIMMRRTGIDHGDMLYYGDGYMTAWFMWLLQNDQYAANAFIGADAEILNNSNWQDISKNID